MSTIKVTQTRSAIGANEKQRETLRSLGLGRIGRATERTDGPQVRGMIAMVAHLVTVEEAK